MTAPLYALTDEYQAIMDEVAEAEGELTPELAERLDAIGDAIEAKAERVGLYVLTLQHTRDAQKAEAARLRAMQTSTQAHIDSLKQYLMDCLSKAGEKRIKTDRISILRARSPVSVIWEPDDFDAPVEYRKVSITPDLAKARDDVKAGKALPFGFVVDGSRTHLRIK